nr:amino acid ABC transporter permease [Candidatus Sigynarchaeota archaeon]
MANPIIDFGVFLFGTALPRFAQGLGTTLLMAGCGIAIGFTLGILSGTGRTFGGSFISKLCAIYIEIVRGVPLIVQILIWRYAFPSIWQSITGFDFFDGLSGLFGVAINPALIAGITAIGINSGGYQAEIIRAGVNAIPTGQTEAGLSLGLRKGQVISTILLPQTLRMVIPPLINEFVIVIKDTSLALAIGVLELASIAQSLTSEFPGQIFEIYITNAMIYFIICYALATVSRVIEKKLAIAGYGVKGRKSLL